MSSTLSSTLIKAFLFGLFETAIITLSAIYVPGLNNVFGIESGTFQFKELIICILLALSTIPVFEIGKAIRRSYNKD